MYISGDGASWIRQGVNWLSKSKFVLDRYHLQKYVRVATTHLNDEAISQDLQDALNLSDKKKLTKVFKKIIEKTGDNESKIKAIKNAKRYILNNWDGIETVSYTHLDVYKRQVIYSIIFTVT